MYWPGCLAISLKGNLLSHVTRKPQEYSCVQLHPLPPTPVLSLLPSPLLPLPSLRATCLGSLIACPRWVEGASESRKFPWSIEFIIPVNRIVFQRCWPKSLEGGRNDWPGLSCVHISETAPASTGMKHWLTGPRASALSLGFSPSAPHKPNKIFRGSKRFLSPEEEMLGRQQSYSLQTFQKWICALKQDTSIKEWIVVHRETITEYLSQKRRMLWVRNWK